MTRASVAGGPRSDADVRAMFTSRNAAYTRFIRAVLYPQALRAFFHASDLLRPGLRILDAGCGTGVLTRALLGAMRDRGLEPAAIDGFDLTPAMLERFRRELCAQGLNAIRLAEANVLELGALPQDWRDYDLVVSSAMLEYLPKQRLCDALAALRERLKPSGAVVIFISRRNVLMHWLIERWWSANLYAKAELAEAFGRAALVPAFRRFPWPYTQHNLWGLIAEGRPPA